VPTLEPSKKLKTQNSKLKTQNSKLKTQNSKLKTQNSKLKTQKRKDRQIMGNRTVYLLTAGTRIVIRP
jgi:cell division protein FtsB